MGAKKKGICLWKKFTNVIDKARTACENSKQEITDHFAQVGKMVQIGSNTGREIKDYKLSRYACYLIVQNADPSKEVIALGQTYFAIQTRKQELKNDNIKGESNSNKAHFNVGKIVRNAIKQAVELCQKICLNQKRV